MELKIYNPTAENTIRAIDWNFEELKQEITERVNDYKTLVYTDDTIKEAKTDRANLNKFVKALEDKRKEIKKMMLEPYNQFESQIKELVGIINDANSNIDSQVKAYDQNKRDEKLEKVKEIYNEVIVNAGYEEIIIWEKVFKDSYLNTSTTLKSVKVEMSELLARVEHEINILNSDAGEYQFEMKEAYLRNFNMSEAVAVKQQYEENARRKAEYEAQRKVAEEERIAREKAEAEKVAHASVKQEAVKEENTSEHAIEETQLVTIEFRVTGTAEQLNQLKQFLKNNNMEYGPIK